MKSEEDIKKRIARVKAAHNIIEKETGRRYRGYEGAYLNALKWVLETEQED